MVCFSFNFVFLNHLGNVQLFCGVLQIYTFCYKYNFAKEMIKKINVLWRCLGIAVRHLKKGLFLDKSSSRCLTTFPWQRYLLIYFTHFYVCSVCVCDCDFFFSVFGYFFLLLLHIYLFYTPVQSISIISLGTSTNW